MAFENSIKKIKEAIRFVNKDLPVIAGTEAVNHFKEGFVKQGFTDKSLEKWQEVERRKKDSPWRGFSYGSNVAKPGKLKKNKNSISNYSPAAETRPILSGETQELMNSIKWEKTAEGIRVYARTAYAKLINEGGPMKIFGKGRSTMPKRQFIGKSEVLRNKIVKILQTELKQILR